MPRFGAAACVVQDGETLELQVKCYACLSRLVVRSGTQNVCEAGVRGAARVH
jgi:hypothetical protein